ncbi:hypothetical protein DW831_02695 [Bacteroides uniformis]|uniref:Uncharacterized protein n=1 Tax=Bacteroides uniformis TaxID=820 RepID=A0A414BM97_BACUN|nr:hypothetical protein DW831_02695 [Bacteroides uniformis]
MLYLEISKKSVPLQCVFHSIRFKVNKGWSTAVLLFYTHTFRIFPFSLTKRHIHSAKRPSSS